MFSTKLFTDITNDLKKVEKELDKYIDTNSNLLNKTSRHLLFAGGKRIRPAFVILAGRMYKCPLEKLLPIAVALEMIHMATLVHDDVVDNSLTRRGKPTVKAKWGNTISLHTGDYLFAKSLVLISSYDNKKIASILADVSVKMCQGEIHQLATAFNYNQNIKDYFYRIKRKTALLISASTQLGALIAEAPNDEVKAFKNYGHYIGMAFQITDDILDIVADEKKLGKPVGSDLRQGIITLPAIYTLELKEYRSQLIDMINLIPKNENAVYDAIQIIKQSNGIDYSLEITRKYIEKAKNELNKLPNVKNKKVFFELADLIYLRNF